MKLEVQNCPRTRVVVVVVGQEAERYWGMFWFFFAVTTEIQAPNLPPPPLKRLDTPVVTGSLGTASTKRASSSRQNLSRRRYTWPVKPGVRARRRMQVKLSTLTRLLYNSSQSALHILVYYYIICTHSCTLKYDNNYYRVLRSWRPKKLDKTPPYVRIWARGQRLGKFYRKSKSTSVLPVIFFFVTYHNL